MVKMMRVQGMQVVRRQPKDGVDAVGVSVRPEAVAFKKGDKAVTKTVEVTAAWGTEPLPYDEPGEGEAYFTCSLLNGQGPGYFLDGRMAWRFDVSADKRTFTYSLMLMGQKEVNEELWFDVDVRSRDGEQMMPPRRMRINVTTAADGEKGDKGDKGDKGNDGAAGLDGCITRTTEWEAGKEYRNDSELKVRGVRYWDVVTITPKDGGKQTAWVCRETHVSTEENKPTEVTTELGYRYWEKMNDMKPIRTSFLLAENAVIRFGQANRLAVMDKKGEKVQACLQGTDTEDGSVLWVGGETAEEANFSVGYDGTMRARRGVFSGLVKREKTVVTPENFLKFFTQKTDAFGVRSYYPIWEKVGLMMSFEGDFGEYIDAGVGGLYVAVGGIRDGVPFLADMTKDEIRAMAGNLIFVENKTEAVVSMMGNLIPVGNSTGGYNSLNLGKGRMTSLMCEYSVDGSGKEAVAWRFTDSVEV